MSLTASSFVVGTPFQATTTAPKRRLPTKTEALFERKQKAEPVAEEKPKKGGIFSKKQKAEPVAEQKPRKAGILSKKQKAEPVAEEKPKKGGIFSKKQKGPRSQREAELLAELEKPRKKQGFLSGVTQALDFSQARSKEDEELLYQARNAKGGRLTDEQAAALRRKIGGTKQDFWKEWVDVKGDYTDKGYVDKAEGIIGLPFLIVVVLGVFGALAYVVSQTSAVPTPPVG